jgi:hypothetical protein
MAYENESARYGEPRTRLTSDDREFLVAKLAEILVLDYQREQGVTGPTVKTGSDCNRKPRAGQAALEQTGHSL